MATMLKILLSVTTLLVCIYGINVFGLSLWPALVAVLSVFLLVSNYFKTFNTAAVVVAKVKGILSLLAFALLLLASMVGGSFQLSESNQIIAITLALMAVFGCAFFLVRKTNVSR